MKQQGEYAPRGYSSEAMKNARIKLAFRKREVSKIKVYTNDSKENRK